MKIFVILVYNIFTFCRRLCSDEREKDPSKELMYTAEPIPMVIYFLSFLLFVLQKEKFYYLIPKASTQEYEQSFKINEILPYIAVHTVLLLWIASSEN